MQLTQQKPGGSAPEPRRYPVTPWSAQRLYRPFVRASLAVALTLGFTTGAGMLLAAALGVDRGIWWVTHTQAHGMAQLFGFAGLFTMGIASHVVPRFRNGSIWFPWPQRASLTLVLLAIVLRFTGQMVNEHPATGILAILSGVLLLAGALVYATAMFAVLFGGRNPVGMVERWIFAGTTWLAISASIHMALTVWLFANEASIAPIYLNSAVIYSALLGFVASFLMGVSTRAVSGFLGLRSTFKRLEMASFAVFQSGLLLAVFSLALEASVETTAAGLLIVAIGVVMFIAALRIFEPSVVRRVPISPGAYTRFEWFIRGAYAWFLVGVVFVVIESTEVLFDIDILPVANASPILHVLTVGFVTSMIIGMGSRMIPLFEGAIVPGRRALDAALALLVISIVTRTSAGFTLEDFTDPILAISGISGLLAIILSTPAVIGSMRESSRAKYRALAQEFGRVKWQESTRVSADPSTGSKRH